MELIAPTRVRLLPGPFQRAQQLDVTYVLSLDPDRLLAPYRREAGLTPVSDSYGNWEDSGLDGHTLGHVLSALATLHAATDDDELRARSEQLVGGLRECQQALGTGYVGGIPGSDDLWPRVAGGDVRPDSFGLNGAWVPWYNLHKLFAGLIDVARHLGDPTAREVVLGLGRWWCELSAGLSAASFEAMLDTEFGGMNGAWADLAELSGEARFLEQAERFSHRRLLEPLLARRDVLDGQHANTQVAKVVGYHRLAARTGREDHREELRGAARWFTEQVVRHRSYAFGGHSVREHFHPVQDCSPGFESPEGPESCNTVNLLHLTRDLFAEQPDEEVLAFHERALVNHVLASQHPDHGGLVYFTPVRPGHYRVYSQPQECFWCCVGTGMEVHARHGELVWGRQDEEVFCHLYLASRLSLPEQGLALEQRATVPPDVEPELVVLSAPDHPVAINLRWPGWADDVEVLLDGEPVPAETRTLGEQGPRYLRLRRVWTPGATVRLRWRLETVAEDVPDGSGWVAFRHGPAVLAARTSTDDLDGLLAGPARMGHVAAGPLHPLAALPVLTATSPATAVAALVPRGNWRWGIAGSDLELEPFAFLHDARYAMYLPWARPGQDEGRREELQRRDETELGLSSQTLDVVRLGEQQPENDHALEGPSRLVRTEDGRARTSGEWFSLVLRGEAGRRLQLGLAACPEATRTRVLLAGEELTVLDRSPDAEPPEPVVLELTVPVTDAVTLRLEAVDGLSTLWLGEVRLLR